MHGLKGIVAMNELAARKSGFTRGLETHVDESKPVATCGFCGHKTNDVGEKHTSHLGAECPNCSTPNLKVA